MTWCPSCGPFVKIDEDGCCVGCGAQSTGAGVDLAHKMLNAVVRFVGTTDRKELQAIELSLRTSATPSEDKAALIDILHALQAIDF